jgi:hypothetical protein
MVQGYSGAVAFISDGTLLLDGNTISTSDGPSVRTLHRFVWVWRLCQNMAQRDQFRVIG